MPVRELIPELALLQAKRLRAAARTRRNLSSIVAGPCRQVEVGAGNWPTPGYIHIDRDPSVNADIYTTADRLPLPDGWAERLLAVHILEHIPAFNVPAVLTEWKRIMKPGAVIDIHVPNGASLARVILANEHQMNASAFWSAMGAAFGYYTPLDATSPTDLAGEVEHCVLYTPASLAAVLESTGFTDTDMGPHECRHSGPWERSVPDLCLRMTAIA